MLLQCMSGLVLSLVSNDSLNIILAGEDGGCIYVSSPSVIQISANAQFHDNEAVNVGGVMYLSEGSNARVVGRVSITNNMASSGGAFYVSSRARVSTYLLA
jgi:hypothetical protein